MHKLIIIFIFIIGISSCESDSNRLVTISGETMGTTYSVKIINPNNIKPNNHIKTQIADILIKINQLMSTYLPKSELSRLNKVDSSEFQTISKELFNIIEYAVQISELTNGAFDVTSGALVDLWGFGSQLNQQTIPSEKKINETKEYVGYKKLILNKNTYSIAKKNPKINIDLSAIAKGYAVDEIARYLDDTYIKDYLVEIGGEIRTKGNNIDNKPWKIAIEQAISKQRKIQRIINLNNAAMATSGDYRNYFIKKGVRYSHIINPLTGKPTLQDITSITIIDSSAAYADAIATAFMVFGYNKSIIIAEKLKIPFYMIIKTEHGFKEYHNELFNHYLSK